MITATRTLECRCGATSVARRGFMSEEAKESGFFPVATYSGEIRWFCPRCWANVQDAIRRLRVACNDDLDGIVPPMLRR